MTECFCRAAPGPVVRDVHVHRRDAHNMVQPALARIRARIRTHRNPARRGDLQLDHPRRALPAHRIQEGQGHDAHPRRSERGTADHRALAQGDARLRGRCRVDVLRHLPGAMPCSLRAPPLALSLSLAMGRRAQDIVRGFWRAQVSRAQAARRAHSSDERQRRRVHRFVCRVAAERISR